MEVSGIILGFFCGFLGGWAAFFLAPFAVLTGYGKAGVLYLAIGAALLGLAYGLGLAPALLLILLVVAFAALVVFCLLTIPEVRLLPKEGHVSVDDVTTIEDVTVACRESGLGGWDLVAYAQSLAAKKFTYSRRNPWDSPSRAFARGLGYCQQQALALNEIYDQLGFGSRPVYANACRFPPAEDAGSSLALALRNRWLRAWWKGQENVFGHTWLRVRVGDEERDVCPGNPNNRPGVVDFEPLSEVKMLRSPLRPLAHLGAAMVNVMLDRAARRMDLGQA